MRDFKQNMKCEGIGIRYNTYLYRKKNLEIRGLGTAVFQKRRRRPIRERLWDFCTRIINVTTMSYKHIQIDGRCTRCIIIAYTCDGRDTCVDQLRNLFLEEETFFSFFCFFHRGQLFNAPAGRGGCELCKRRRIIGIAPPHRTAVRSHTERSMISSVVRVANYSETEEE